MTDAETACQHAVDNFIALHMTYKFTATIVTTNGNTTSATADSDPSKGVIIRFVFSKPTIRQPTPPVTVYMDLHIVGSETDKSGNTKWLYDLYFEGQKYRRRIEMVAGAVTGQEFNEKLIDKVHDQKEVIRQRQMWA